MSLNKHKIIPLIESYYHTFTPLERTIADFFIHNTEEQDFSSRNISGLLYVSEASLSRFAQKCGFHGYREFIYEYKQRLAPGPEENIPNFEVSEFNTYQELLNKSNALLDKAQITRITNLLVSKPRVYVYGRGSSGLVAQEMKLRFMRIGLNIEAVTDSHIMKCLYRIFMQSFFFAPVNLQIMCIKYIQNQQNRKLWGNDISIFQMFHACEDERLIAEVLIGFVLSCGHKKCNKSYRSTSNNSL